MLTKKQNKIVNQNSWRRLRQTLTPVAAGTISRALMSSTPTERRQRLTISASSTMKA